MTKQSAVAMGVSANLTTVTWAHAVNSVYLLTIALNGKCLQIGEFPQTSLFTPHFPFAYFCMKRIWPVNGLTANSICQKFVRDQKFQNLVEYLNDVPVVCNIPRSGASEIN